MRNSRNHSASKSFSVTYLSLLSALVLFVVLMGVILILLTQQGERSEVQLSLASEQRLLSRAAVAEALEAARGKESAFTRLKNTRDRFEQILKDQRSSSAAPLPALDELDNRWKPMRGEIDTILAGQESVMSLNNFVPLLETPLTQMITLSDEIAKSLSNNRGDPRQVYLATNQLLLGQRIESDLKRMLTEGGLSAAAAADRLKRNVNLFGRVLKGMREGGLNLPDSAGKLADIADLFKSLEAETARILEKAGDLAKAQNAAQGIADKGDALLEAATQLLDAYTAQSRRFSCSAFRSAIQSPTCSGSSLCSCC